MGEPTTFLATGHVLILFDNTQKKGNAVVFFGYYSIQSGRLGSFRVLFRVSDGGIYVLKKNMDNPSYATILLKI
jgi:predicted ABC-type ATPase